MAAPPSRVGVKRNIFQQISHVCLIMYITACGAENQSTTTAAIATHPSLSASGGSAASDRLALLHQPPLAVSPAKEGSRETTVRRCILF